MKKIVRVFSSVVIMLALSSCASSTNMNDGGANMFGGGIGDTEVAPGVYRITARTNFAPYENFGGARSMWDERAEEVCTPGKYRAVRTWEYTQEEAPSILGIVRYIVSIKRGYAVCESSGLSDEEVIDIIEGRG